MKISVIGAGSIGKRHLKNCVALQDELSFSEIRCFDPDSSRIAALKNELPGIIAKDNLADAVDNVDAVIVCVPTSLHIPVITEIIKNKPYHIYLEKPLSHSVSGCDELVFSQKRANKVLVVGYMLPNHPVLLKTKEMLDAKVVGRVLSVRAESGFYLPKWHPWEDYRNFYMSWKSGGGGALLDTSHEINYLQWLFGDIDEIKGFVGTVSDLEITSDDLVTALFQFKNGIFGELHLDLLQFDEARFCKIIGTEAVLTADLTKNTICMSNRKDSSWKEELLEVDFDKIYHNQLREFVAACNGNSHNLITGEEALNTMQVVEAIRRSHAYSTTVKLPIYD